MAKFIKRILSPLKISLYSLAFLGPCGGKSLLMTQKDYEQIIIGTPSSIIVEKYGPPLQITTTEPDTEEYKYTERFMVKNQTIQQNFYIVVVQNGKVIAKKSSQAMQPADDESIYIEENETN
jgi:hypothetical protein